MASKILCFGKHKGETFSDVYKLHSEYVDWCFVHIEWARFENEPVIGPHFLFDRAHPRYMEQMEDLLSYCLTRDIQTGRLEERFRRVRRHWL